MDGSKSKSLNMRRQAAVNLRWGIAPRRPRFFMRIGCIQSAIDSPAFAPTAPDCSLDRRWPERLMKRDPTGNYFLRVLLIATNEGFEQWELGRQPRGWRGRHERTLIATSELGQEVLQRLAKDFHVL
jgi:hypothetical protein